MVERARRPNTSDVTVPENQVLLAIVRHQWLVFRNPFQATSIECVRLGVSAGSAHVVGQTDGNPARERNRAIGIPCCVNLVNSCAATLDTDSSPHSRHVLLVGKRRSRAWECYERGINHWTRFAMYMSRESVGGDTSIDCNDEAWVTQ